MKVILIGDVVGKPGRRALLANLKQLKVQHEAEFVVANVENAAEGAGVVPKIGDEILSAGVDVMTSGNHIYDKREVIAYIENQPRLLRPANYAPETPGRGGREVYGASGGRADPLQAARRDGQGPRDGVPHQRRGPG